MTGAVRIATRKSELAIWQARHVAGLLRTRHPGLEVELVPLVTEGDRILDRPLARIGGKGLFLKELEVALLDGRADLAVHSMKDVPVVETPGLSVDVVLERANPFDAWLSPGGDSLDDLPAGSRVGTSSLRRQCQLLSARPDLIVNDLRGNVNTRVRKLDAGQYDAIILACAGLERLGLGDRITHALEPPLWLPAATQGTIGLQQRTGDDDVSRLTGPLNDPASALRTRAERAVAAALEGSCQVPLAVFADLVGDGLNLRAMVGTPDGERLLRSERSGSADHAGRLAQSVADDLLGQGADEIIAGLSQ